MEKETVTPNHTTRQATVHELKCWPAFFEDVIRGRKTFELRFNDRDFQAGDDLLLKEWSPQDGYTSRETKVHVPYMIRQGFGLQRGWVCMGIVACPQSEP